MSLAAHAIWAGVVLVLGLLVRTEWRRYRQPASVDAVAKLTAAVTSLEQKVTALEGARLVGGQRRVGL